VSLSREHDRLFYSARKNTRTGTVHLKLVNANRTPEALIIAGLPGDGPAQLSGLHAPTWNDTNSITDPDHFRTAVSTISVSNGEWSNVIPANTIEVMHIQSR
jgi:hypothetical protein